MRKALLLVVLALALPGLLQAQGSSAPPAPKPGHPLDPADVAILTGKQRSPTPYGAYAASPAYYYTGAVDGLFYRQSVFAPVTTATAPPFSPLLFGRVGDRPFFVIGRTGPLAVPGFFFGRGLRGRGNVVVLPGGGPFFFGRH